MTPLSIYGLFHFAPARGRNMASAHEHGGWKIASAVFLLCAAAPIAASAQSFTTLANFNVTNGAYPQYVSLVQGTDGNLYGTTSEGGAAGHCLLSRHCGIVFKITPTGTLTTLYSFCAQISCTDGSEPYAGLVLGSDGNFYGTTVAGGASGYGTVFKITPAGTPTTLHSFDNFTDGGIPQVGLAQGSDGNFYGTATQGGAHGSGTVFKITPGGAFSTLYDFCALASCADGATPNGLIQATNGNFYGTTGGGGARSDGTVFQITPTGILTTLHSFAGTDGSVPHAGLVQATNGNLYGTTFGGGISSFCTSVLGGCGTVFRITPAGTLTTLYNFCAEATCPDGWEPIAGVIQATDGNFYGTTSGGGANGHGTIFEITPEGVLTALHSFSGTPDGWPPYGRLLQATNATFYGTTFVGGSSSDGTVFSLSMNLSPFVSLLGGPAKVGQTLGILGQGLTGTSSVSMNGTSATFTFLSDTYLTATVPAGVTTGPVIVTTPSGTLISNLPFRVTPQLLSFRPISGSVGTSVTITGVSLTQVTGISFGGVKATSFTVNSDTQVTATVPTGAKTGPVGIQTLGGHAASTQIFTVTP